MWRREAAGAPVVSRKDVKLEEQRKSPPSQGFECRASIDNRRQQPCMAAGEQGWYPRRALTVEEAFGAIEPL
jgi:hypothetical protein